MKAANDNRHGTSFVYIVTSPEQNAFKVGFSNGTPRIHSLQTGNPAHLILVRAIAAERQCENAIHKALAAYRLRGEWFTDDGLSRFLVDELLDALHGADQCSRLMLPSEATEAAAKAIRFWLLDDDEDSEEAA